MDNPNPKNLVRILVVDDHPNTAATLARALTQLGPSVDVISATSGRDALGKIKDQGVDILITDMIMPEMTGLELIEKMQNHPGGRPAYTYLITAYDVPGLKVTAHRLKVNEVIVKPVRPERICQIASQAMREMEHATNPAKRQTSGKKKAKILVADDKPDNRMLLSRYLEFEGFDYVVAEDGLEALDKTRDELPDLVLLDVNMPNKDGFAVLEDIRSDPAIEHIPVIILTAARLDPVDVQSGLNLGADDYVTKPFDRHELMARIRTKLRVKEAEDAIRRRNRELNLLPEIGKELSARLNIKDLADILLRRTVETLGAAHGQMVILDAVGKVGEIYRVAASNTETFEGSFITDELLKFIHEQNRGAILADALNDPNWPKIPGDNTRSAVVVPLFGRRELLGVIVLTHENENYFTLEHLLLLQAISSQAAIAIENANLYANELREQKRLEAVLQNAAEAILMFDEQGQLTLLNPAGENLFTDIKTQLNQPLPENLGYDGFIQMIEEVQKNRMAKAGDVVWPDGRTFSALLTPIESVGSVAILHDVTRFKDLDKVKNEFIATASHDLKNPITSVNGYSDLLVKTGSLSEQQLEFVHRIKSAAAAMNELVQNMMELVRIDLNAQQKLDPVEMGTLLVEIVNEFKPQAAAKEQALNLVSPDTPVFINGDALQLKQLFRNLIGNAIKYTPSNGQVDITTEQDASKLTISVQDTGYGIPTAELPFIFNRFYRVRSGKHAEEEGNGLGLAIVKSIVEKHAGQVAVESEPDEGSCFTVQLPTLFNRESMEDSKEMDLASASSRSRQA